MIKHLFIKKTLNILNDTQRSALCCKVLFLTALALHLVYSRKLYYLLHLMHVSTFLSLHTNTEVVLQPSIQDKSYSGQIKYWMQIIKVWNKSAFQIALDSCRLVCDVNLKLGEQSSHYLSLWSTNDQSVLLSE